MSAGAIPPQHPPWGTQVPLTWVTEGYPEYGALVRELRGFLDALAAARPEPADSAALADTLREWRATLRQTATGEHGQVFGRRPDLPSRGHTMLPDYVVHEVGETTISADVRFGRFFLGGGEAVHGGAIPLVFDELFGTLVNFGRRPPSRTVRIATNFRAITPLDTELHVVGRIDRVDGRKTFVSGELLDGDRVCADAEALFVAIDLSALVPPSAP